MGDGGPDGYLVRVLVIEQVQVERCTDSALEPDGYLGDEVSRSSLAPGQVAGSTVKPRAVNLGTTRQLGRCKA
jgi:hypothetical protein